MAGVADMRRYRATSRVTPAQRHAAMRAAAQWALTQPDPEDALAELLGALGLIAHSHPTPNGRRG